LRRAAEISGEGLIEVMPPVRPGMTTLEVVGTMEAVWKREDSPRAAFETIVKAGSLPRPATKSCPTDSDAVERLMASAR
jgi:Xaa-Pro aminopeptidase